jgi:hypothetical protein
MIRIPLPRLPYPPYVRRIAATAAVVWLGMRFAAAVFGLLAPGVHATVLIVLVCAAAVWMDLRRTHEHLFHGNLGTSPLWSIAVAMATAGALEIALQSLLRFSGVPFGRVVVG